MVWSLPVVVFIVWLSISSGEPTLKGVSSSFLYGSAAATTGSITNLIEHIDNARTILYLITFIH